MKTELFTLQEKTSGGQGWNKTHFAAITQTKMVKNNQNVNKISSLDDLSKESTIYSKVHY